MKERELTDLNIQLTRQLLHDYQELKQQKAFLRRSLNRIESFLNDARRQAVQEETNHELTKNEKEALIKIVKDIIDMTKETMLVFVPEDRKYPIINKLNQFEEEVLNLDKDIPF